ncbi:MAG: bifunctional (p)ppGpp synthetase/guanosine-3',5'-bis(diphosphate) 3'-pyrophosphohydrolase [Bacteroidales bacterium]|nr:bifunctional (p)ppGpp synthetase/guanosine-3',5'-bis(diphosphate) 3'-pyrophosphohydrolase [Bacteroidales bacterium]
MMFTKEDNDLIYKEFESLRLASLKRCANKEEYEGVVRAFEFANEAHKGVRRRSGEPYILHPIAVAKIVVQEIGLGYKSIVTALLHDIVEDTEYTVEDISRLFGEKVASLVDGLTKIKSAMDTNHNKAQGGDKNAKLSENQEKSLQAENFKRILLTLNDDVRVILIKLADRLHNLRTIDSMPERKKDKILSETMYIFIPLAHRLGLYSIKSEMENIWLRFRQPDDYAYIQKKLAIYTQEKSCDIDRFIEPIEKILKKEGYKFTISKRTKTPYSIWRKMQNKGIQFDQIYDLFAIRIIFEPKEGITERQQCYDIFSLISADYISKPDRLRDWVGRPKSNGYEALHCTLMSTLGNWMEVQIRSRRMDEIAERGLAAHWSYKGVQKNESELDNWLNMVREVLENPDVSALEFLDKFHASLLSSEIYVFTPTGESKKLQKGATALDFAYYIHSKIGERAIAAKVNLKLVPLSHVLQNGDQVEIITAETQKPKREWLDFVTTTKAKRLIYDSLKADIKNAIKEGQNALDQALAKLGVTPQNRVFKKLLLEYNLNNKDELYNKIGTGLIDLSELEKVLKKNNENKFVKFWNLQFFFGNSDKEKDDQEGDDIQNEVKRPKVDKKKDYLLEENPLDKTLSYKAAECCNPIPGDPIIGFLDDNNEVVIHKKVCPHAISLASRQGGKIVNAKWTKHTILSFLARIGLKGIDRIGIVNEITKYITLVLSVNIRKIHFETHDGIFEGYIDLYVHNTEDLEMIMKRMLKIKGVESATRTDIKE